MFALFLLVQISSPDPLVEAVKSISVPLASLRDLTAQASAVCDSEGSPGLVVTRIDNWAREKKLTEQQSTALLMVCDAYLQGRENGLRHAANTLKP